MKHHFAFWAGAITSVMLVASGSASAQCTIWGGTVSGTWTAACSPYIIKGDITARGLTINPGVVVKFDPQVLQPPKRPGIKLTISTWIRALGTAKQPIVFTVNGTGLWGGIKEVNLSGQTRKSQYEYCTFEKAAGAFWISNSLPVIKNCVIRDCSRETTADPYGGGVRVSNGTGTGTLTMTGCVIRDCKALIHGGGLYAQTAGTASIVLDNCVIESNQANPKNLTYQHSYGGGVYISGTSTITRCLIRNNRCNAYHSPGWTNNAHAYAYGGGAYLHGNVNIINSNIVTNTVASTAVRGNVGPPSPVAYAYDAGAGVFFDGNTSGAANITGTIIARNHAYAYYPRGGARATNHCGGLYISRGACNLVNVTIARNTTNQTPRFAVYGPSKTTTFLNSIIYHNTGTQLSSTMVNVKYSCIEGAKVWPGTGNINANPGFGTNSEMISGTNCKDKGDPSTTYNDKSLMPFGPGIGTSHNDMGAHGGPRNDGWMRLPVPTCSVTPASAPVNKPGTFKLAISGGNPRALFLFLIEDTNGGLWGLMYDTFRSELNWDQTFYYTPAVKGVVKFRVATLTPDQNGYVLSLPCTWTVK